MPNTRRTRLAVLFLQPIQQFMGLLIGVYTMMWGLWTLSPWWSVFDKGPQFELMMDLATEPVWGALALVLGFFVIKSCWSKSIDVIRFTALIGFYFWGIVSMSYLYSDWQALAWLPSAYFSLTEGYAYINLTVRERRKMIANSDEVYNI